MDEILLVGDIGGTKTDLALVSGGIFSGGIKTVSSKEFQSLEEIVAKVFPNIKIDRACFGVAGPVKNQECHTTNLPWIVDARAIAKKFGIQEVLLINDLKAMAYGLINESKEMFYQLNKGKEVAGNQAIIAPGTGLGESILYFDGKKQIPMASEGGHVDFAPRNEREIELYRYLRKMFPHVSYERILSGDGISHIYSFLNQGQTKEPEEVTKEALTDKSTIGYETIRWFCEILGAEAGNLALKSYAIGGIYIGGGIPIKILEILKGEDFLRGFTDKGRFGSFLENIPVFILLNTHINLFGAQFFLKTNKN